MPKDARVAKRARALPSCSGAASQGLDGASSMSSKSSIRAFWASWYSRTRRGSLRSPFSSNLPARSAARSKGFAVACGGCAGGRWNSGAPRSSMASDITEWGDAPVRLCSAL